MTTNEVLAEAFFGSSRQGLRRLAAEEQFRDSVVYLAAAGRLPRFDVLPAFSRDMRDTAARAT